MIIGTFVPHSPEWYAARRWRVGASEVATILGLSPYRTTAAELMRQKLDGTIRPETRAMRRGTFLEAGVLAWAAAEYRLDLAPTPGTYVHDVLDWALANPDAMTVDGAVVEVKTTIDRTREDGWGRGGTDAIPLAYQCQVEWECGVTGATEWHLVVLSGGVNGRPSLDLAHYYGRAAPARFASLTGYVSRWHQRLITIRDQETS